MRQRIGQYIHIDLPSGFDLISAATTTVLPGVPGIVKAIGREY
jgi:hypothetical protein